MSHQIVSVGCFSLKFYGFTCFMIHIITFSKNLNVHLLLQKKPHTNLSSFEDALWFDQTPQSSCVCNPASAVPALQAQSVCYRHHSPVHCTVFLASSISCSPSFSNWKRETLIRKMTCNGEDESLKHVDLVIFLQYLSSICLLSLRYTLSWRL